MAHLLEPVDSAKAHGLKKNKKQGNSMNNLWIKKKKRETKLEDWTEFVNVEKKKNFDNCFL